MIIKSLTRKTASFRQLLSYINAPEGKGKSAISHNLKSHPDNLKAIGKEFAENARFCPKRINGVILYHEILSLAEGDRENVTEEILTDLCRKYLELRASDAIAYAKAHLHSPCPHLHVIISGNLIESPKKLRLSKTKFERIKRELERYQKERYPFLTHSVAFSGEKEKTRSEQKKKRPEQERDRRMREQGEKQLSRKEAVRRRAEECFALAESEDDFKSRLKAAGLEFYMRGKHAGVKDATDGKKYRFNTLGIDEKHREALSLWQQLSRRKKEIEAVTAEKLRRELRELGFAGEALSVLSFGGEGLPEEQRSRKKELERILDGKKQRARAKERGRDIEFS